MSEPPCPSPGAILRKEFMDRRRLSIYRLAKETGIPATRISGILHKRRRINAEAALRLARYFSNDPEFWLGIQNRYDLEEEGRRLAEELSRIKRIL